MAPKLSQSSSINRRWVYNHKGPKIFLWERKSKSFCEYFLKQKLWQPYKHLGEAAKVRLRVINVSFLLLSFSQSTLIDDTNIILYCFLSWAHNHGQRGAHNNNNNTTSEKKGVIWISFLAYFEFSFLIFIEDHLTLFSIVSFSSGE